MTFLPIVARELRVAARRSATYWTRAGAGLALIVVGTWFFLMSHHQRPQQVAKELFGLLTGTSVLFCLLSGIRATADCLSEEKREGTLGLLFLTDLKGYDVVLGKLVATSLNAFYGLLAVVPMLAVPILLGGLTLGEFGRVALLAVNTLFLSLSIGMGVSAVCRSARKARGMTFLLILCFAGLLPALGGWLDSLGKVRSPPLAFFLSSPGFAYYASYDAVYKATPGYYWTSAAVIHGIAWVFLILASLVAPRSWQDRPAGVQRLRWRELWRSWSYGDVVERTAFRKRLLDTNAYFWLAARARLKPASVWAVLGLLACAWFWGLVKFSRADWLNEGVYFTTGVILNLLIKGWFASETGRQLADDRQHGALELLLSTPLTVRDILHGQLLALQRQFLAPVVLTLVLFLVFMLATLAITAVDSDHPLWISLWGGGMVMLVADLAALYWVGMWRSLKARSPHRAASESLALILVLPWGGMAIAVLVVSLASMSGHFEPTWKFFLALWLLLGLGIDLLFGAWARHRLYTEFRTVAAQRFAAPNVGFWRKWFGFGRPAEP
jgi:ABC-type transport system involved in cytochrome c biogenesis permease component